MISALCLKLHTIHSLFRKHQEVRDRPSMVLKHKENSTRSQMSDQWKDDKTQGGEGALWGSRPS